MDPSLSSIKAIGFDLDRTLYTDTPKMRGVILNSILTKVLELKPKLGTLKRVSDIYALRDSNMTTWKEFLNSLGIAHSEEIVQTCLESSGFIKMIPKDPKLSRLLQCLSQKYYLFIISGSTKNYSIAKLQKIGIDPTIFKFLLFADDKHFKSKTNPHNFEYFLSKSPFDPNEHTYIGDNHFTDIQIPKSIGFKTVAIGSTCPIADFSLNHIHKIADLFLNDRHG